jgi:glucose/arabinose dehydrogenase
MRRGAAGSTRRARGLLAAGSGPLLALLGAGALLIAEHDRAAAAGAVPALVAQVEEAPEAGAPSEAAGPTDQAAEPTGTVLLVDDAAAANPELVEAPLEVPPGFDGQPRTVRLPRGFSVSLVAAGLARPRFMAFDEAGHLLVADLAGSVYRYPSAAGALEPASAPPPPLLRGLQAPSSLAFHAGYLYVGETHQVSRYQYDPAGAPGPQEVVVPDLPVGGHSTRTVAFGPDGVLYVSVGSSCNICLEEDERRAAVLRYHPDGSGYERFAWGLRNAVGLAFQPGTGLLWATVNERDWQGNEVPPDLVTIVRAGQDFGWPWCQPPEATPQEPGADCSGVTPPTIGIQAHSAPLALAFYAGPQFPAEYQGDLFVAQHGSWNREPPAAPKLLRVRFEAGGPASAEDFAAGWQTPEGSRWGRPAGLVVAPDGSLIVSDDLAGVLYRIRHGP